MCRDLSGRWVAVGVVSFGNVPCTYQPARPAVFSRLDFYSDWIQAVMRRLTVYDHLH